MLKKVVSIILSVFIAFFWICPFSYADSENVDLSGIVELADWLIFDLMQNAAIGGTNSWNAMFDENVCEASTEWNGRHQFVEMNTQVDGNFGRYYICKFCGKSAGEVLNEAESEYVATLPAQEINSDGGLVWYPTVDNLHTDFNYACEMYYGTYGAECVKLNESNHYSFSNSSASITLQSDKRSFSFYKNFGYEESMRFGFTNLYFTVPVSGQYRIQSQNVGSVEILKLDGTSSRSDFVLSAKNFSCNIGDYISCSSYISVKGAILSGELWFPAINIIPVKPYDFTSIDSSDTYYIGTRASSITGNYGIVNSGSGEVTKIDSQTIVNETNNTYYSPSTGEQQTFTDWSYDYGDRTYNLTTESGDTVTITYGDEHVTVNEGDTITNIYYITETSSGGSGGEDTPVNPPHQHQYSSEVTTEPNCTRSGVRTYTCTCGATYTETIPANKHNWQIIQDVKNEYDAETGELLQQGYTVYQCSVCGQQYRQDDESLPPGVIGQNTDLMEIGENGQSLISSLSGMYDGYLSLVTSLFPYLPEEIRKLLYFGITSVVSLGIFKGIRR